MTTYGCAQDVAGGGHRSGQHQPAGEAAAGTGPGGGQAGGAALVHLVGADEHQTMDAQDLGIVLAQIAQGEGVS